MTLDEGANLSATDHVASWDGGGGARHFAACRNDCFPRETRRASGRERGDGARRGAGRLALALDPAARYCKRTQISFTVYAAKARQQMPSLDALRDGDERRSSSHRHRRLISNSEWGLGRDK
jgi:hypothetical protein